MARLPAPEVTYTSGLSKNMELFIGPWFVICGLFGTFVLVFFPAENLRPDQPPPPQGVQYPLLIFVVVGLVLCYLGYGRRVYRVEIHGETLYWFAPFRRLKGQAPIADIVSIWTDGTLQRRVTRTGFDLRDDRMFSIRDRHGISAFVAELIARSPDIKLTYWEPHEPGGSPSIGSFYVNDD
jgi:hypothetical protein